MPGRCQIVVEWSSKSINLEYSVVQLGSNSLLPTDNPYAKYIFDNPRVKQKKPKYVLATLKLGGSLPGPVGPI